MRNPLKSLHLLIAAPSAARVLSRRARRSSWLLAWGGALLLMDVSCCHAGAVRATISSSNGVPVANVALALYGSAPAVYSGVATAVMDQRNKQFEPKLLVVRKNTQVSFPNSDDMRHQVYSFSPAKRFELRLYHGTPASPVLFDTPGEVALGCNIHDSMVGYIYVVDTPWFGSSDPQGRIAIAAVPPGSYRARLWYPGVAADAKGLEQKITVAEGDTALSFNVDAPASQAAPASELQQLFNRRSVNAP